MPFSLEGSIVVTFAENWLQSKYVVSDPRTVWPVTIRGTCVYPIRGTCCLSVYSDLLLECVLMDSAFNGKYIV